jgi:hypothetical protein
MNPPCDAGTQNLLMSEMMSPAPFCKCSFCLDVDKIGSRRRFSPDVFPTEIHLQLLPMQHIALGTGFSSFFPRSSSEGVLGLFDGNNSDNIGCSGSSGLAVCVDYRQVNVLVPA